MLLQGEADILIYLYIDVFGCDDVMTMILVSEIRLTSSLRSHLTALATGGSKSAILCLPLAQLLV